MTKSLFALNRSLLAALLALLTLPLLVNACDESGPVDDDTTGDDDTNPPDPLEITPASLSFSHTYGTSPCPQGVGTLTFVNNTNEDANWSATSMHAAIEVSVAQGIVSPNSSVDVEVSFNCSQCPPAGITSEIRTNLYTTSDSISPNIPVDGTFSGCP